MELVKLRKILFKDRTNQVAPIEKGQVAEEVGGIPRLVYNDEAKIAKDVGAGAFDRFDSVLDDKRTKKIETIGEKMPIAVNLNTKRKKSINGESHSLERDNQSRGRSRSKSKERSDQEHFVESCTDLKKKKRRKKKKKRSRSKGKTGDKEENKKDQNEETSYGDKEKDFANSIPLDSYSHCQDCLMENCKKQLSAFQTKPIDFSFIFKDDKPLNIVEDQDKEVVENPQEPIRIEERTRKRRKKEKRKRKSKTVQLVPKITNTKLKKVLNSLKDIKNESTDGKVDEEKKEDNENQKVKKKKKKKKTVSNEAPVPTRDMSKFEAQETLLDLKESLSGSGMPASL